MFAAIPVRLVDEGIDWPAWDWPAWITLGVVLVTAVLALLALVDARRTRHGQLVVEILRDWSTREAEEAHALHGELTEDKLVALTDRLFKPPRTRPSTEELEKDLTTWNQLVRLANLVEALGVLASEKAIASKTVYKMWGGPILEAWPKWDEAVKRLRRYVEEPDQFQYFEEIAVKMRRISRKRKRRRERQRRRETTS
jgi:hypothetical protein